MIRIIGDVDRHRIYCAGSLTKLLTTYVSLSLLAEKFDLDVALDDEHFLDSLCNNTQAKAFLTLFQDILGGRFTIRDLCSYYSGLPYTFDLSEKELERVEAGLPFKHHHIPDEETFLYMCKNKITPVYKNKCKFHYSEIGILFMGYFLEKVYDNQMEYFYKKYVINKFNLSSSYFSRKRVKDVFIEDLSDKYDYPAIAILDHGYFCYSNGFYTTLNDMKKLLEHFIREPVFKCMTNIKKARAASPRLLNGLAVEIRLVGDDIIYGYEGLSFSGCNIWAYSTKYREGYLTLTNNEEDAYPIIYDHWRYSTFDKVPAHTQTLYMEFIKHYDFDTKKIIIPDAYQGQYHRVNINEKSLEIQFLVGPDYIVIRNPEEIKYNVMYYNNHFCIKCKDNVHGGKVGFYTAEGENHYMLYDGTLYKKLTSSHG